MPKISTNKAPTNTSTDVMQDVNMPLTPGQQLRQAREEKKLSLEDVAKQLSFGKEIIVGLENDDYSKIVAPVYTRGYLSAYARLLQIPSEAILKDFNSTSSLVNPSDTAEQPSIKVLHPIKIDSHKEQKGSSLTIYTTIAILIAAVFVWGYNHHQNAALKGVSLPKNIESIKTNAESNDGAVSSNHNSSPGSNTLNIKSANKPTEQESTSSAVSPPVTDAAQSTSQTTSNIEIPPDPQD